MNNPRAFHENDHEMFIRVFGSVPFWVTTENFSAN